MFKYYVTTVSIKAVGSWQHLLFTLRYLLYCSALLFRYSLW